MSPPLSRRALLAGTVTLTAGLAGCSVLSSPTRETEATELLTASLAALGDAESVQYESNVDVSGPEQTTASLVGEIDFETRQLSATVTLDEEKTQAYLDGETLRYKCSTGDLWAEEKPEPRDPWWRMTPLGSQLSGFESGRLVTAGTDRLDRDAVHQLESSPPDTRTSIVGGVFGGVPGEASGTATLAIDAETYYPRAVSIDATLEETDRDVTMHLESRFFAYNETVSIAIPTAATENPWPSCPGGY